jgi:hypothetical protein
MLWHKDVRGFLLFLLVSLHFCIHYSCFIVQFLLPFNIRNQFHILVEYFLQLKNFMKCLRGVLTPTRQFLLWVTVSATIHTATAKSGPQT